MRTWRLIGMLILFIMLLVALIPTGNAAWFELWADVSFSGGDATPISTGFYSVPAECLWKSRYWHGYRWNAALTYLILLANYTALSVALFQPTEQIAKRSIRDCLLRRLRHSLDKAVEKLQVKEGQRGNASFIARAWYNILLSIYAIVFSYLELYSSFFGTLWWLLVTIGWGAMQVILPRLWLPAIMREKENQWGFGQIVVLLLLALPASAVFEFHQGSNSH